jgi:hypothetical protein
MILLCKFCQKPVALSPVEEAIRMNVQRYWCGVCRAEYLMFPHEEVPNSISLYTCRGDKFYRWTVTKTGRAVLYYVKQMFNEQHLSHDCEVLYSMSPEDNQPDITPENVADKIKTMLIFL